MQANIVDLRYRMRKVLKALEARETVTIYSRGKVKGVIMPPAQKNRIKAKDHPSFGIMKGDKRTVAQIMDELRGGRYRALRH